MWVGDYLCVEGSGGENSSSDRGSGLMWRKKGFSKDSVRNLHSRHFAKQGGYEDTHRLVGRHGSKPISTTWSAKSNEVIYPGAMEGSRRGI